MLNDEGIFNAAIKNARCRERWCWSGVHKTVVMKLNALPGDQQHHPFHRFYQPGDIKGEGKGVIRPGECWFYSNYMWRLWLISLRRTIPAFYFYLLYMFLFVPSRMTDVFIWKQLQQHFYFYALLLFILYIYLFLLPLEYIIISHIFIYIKFFSFHDGVWTLMFTFPVISSTSICHTGFYRHFIYLRFVVTLLIKHMYCSTEMSLNHTFTIWILICSQGAGFT